MSRMIIQTALLTVLLAAAAATVRAEEVEIADIAWHGNDVVLTLSDSAGYALDLARSDTGEAVFALVGVALAENLRSRSAGVEASMPGVAISVPGPDGRTAVLSQRADGSVTLRVHSAGGLGYATLWRPFVHQLVVHTFGWDGLGYGEGQYYQGLIALEQGVDEQAEELLAIAASTGEARASGVLGSRYARRGDDSLALQYLRDPRTAEEHAALATVLERRGDTAEAARHFDQSKALLATGDTPGSGGATATSLGTKSPDEDEILQARQRNVWLLVVFGLLGLLLLAGLLIAASRRRRSGARVDYKRATAPTTATTQTPAFKVVRTEPTEAAEPVVREERAPVVDAEAAPPRPADAPAHEPEHEPQQTAQEAPLEPRPASPTPWTSAASRTTPASATSQAADLQARLRAAELRPGADEPTVAAARRLKLSRDNVELRKRIDAATEERGRNSPN